MNPCASLPMRISPEAIYQSLYVQGRGALKRELVACLRTGRSLRVPRERTRQSVRGHVTADVLISERPAEAADRAVPGHWEGDRATRSCTNLSGLTDWRGS
jgi:IS30 family transposase